MTDEVDDFLARLDEAVPSLERIDTTAPIKEGSDRTLGTVYMRKQSGEDRWRLLTMQSEFAKAGRTRIPPAAVVAWALVKADGSPRFDDVVEGFRRLCGIRREALDELYDHALRVTGLGAEAVENAEKKSSSSQSSESGTNSPS